jgi:hypothetical protein
MGKDPAFGSGSSGIVINQFTYSSKIQVTCMRKSITNHCLELITNKFSFSDSNNDKVYIYGANAWVFYSIFILFAGENIYIDK